MKIYVHFKIWDGNLSSRAKGCMSICVSVCWHIPQILRIGWTDQAEMFREDFPWHGNGNAKQIPYSLNHLPENQKKYFFISHYSSEADS